jgi:ubiquinone/menaquinone biosynthesis C-methylase UbiE
VIEGVFVDKIKLVRVFDRQARQYDKRRKRMAQKEWREKLLRNAEGRVLELAVGAGANFVFYPPGVKVTAVDFSPQMLSFAKQAAVENGIEVDFRLSDIETLNFPPQSFDTIVSTLSLCGYENPARLLKNLNQWCKPEGQILLMEHGRSSNPILAFVQRVLDPLAYKMIGCHQTRDIPQLVRDSGLTILREESHWFDTVHLIWAKPGTKR